MKLCPKCKTLYSELLDVCPKCGIDAPEDSDSAAEPDRKARTRGWIGIVIGIPSFIGFLYLIYFLYSLLAK